MYLKHPLFSLISPTLPPAQPAQGRLLQAGSVLLPSLVLPVTILAAGSQLTSPLSNLHHKSPLAHLATILLCKVAGGWGPGMLDADNLFFTTNLLKSDSVKGIKADGH